LWQRSPGIRYFDGLHFAPTTGRQDGSWRNRTLLPAMEQIGRRFSANDQLFLAELWRAARRSAADPNGQIRLMPLTCRRSDTAT
jgi:hypothetical protein